MYTHNKNWWEITHVINQSIPTRKPFECNTGSRKGIGAYGKLKNPQRYLHCYRANQPFLFLPNRNEQRRQLQNSPVEATINNRNNSSGKPEEMTEKPAGGDRQFTVASAIQRHLTFANICYCLLTSGAVVHHHIEWAVASLKSFNHAL